MGIHACHMLASVTLTSLRGIPCLHKTTRSHDRMSEQSGYICGEMVTVTVMGVVPSMLRTA